MAENHIAKLACAVGNHKRYYAAAVVGDARLHAGWIRKHIERGLFSVLSAFEIPGIETRFGRF